MINFLIFGLDLLGLDIDFLSLDDYLYILGFEFPA